jgi:orotate phosphoribosyltransferase
VSPARLYAPPSRRTQRERLLRIVAGALAGEPYRRGDGRMVRDYVQGHVVLGDAEGLRLAASLMLDAVRETSATVVAGEVSAACALVSGIVALSGLNGSPLTGRYVRRQEREYGIPGRLTAPVPAGSDMFLVDDVAATGGSGVRCVEALRALGHRVVAMMVLVDREQGAAERLQDLGVELTALFRLDEVREAKARRWAKMAASG